MTAMTQDNSARTRRFVLATLIGGVAGFVGMYFGMTALGREAVDLLDGAQIRALALAMICIITAAITGFGTLAPRAGSRFLNVEDEEELREATGMLWPSVVAIALIGIVFASLALAGVEGFLSRGTAAAVVAILILPIVLLSRLSITRSDELMKNAMSQTAEVSFHLVAFVIGGWAIAAHLGLVAAPALLDLVSVLFAAMLVASFAVLGKRGMLMR